MPTAKKLRKRAKSYGLQGYSTLRKLGLNDQIDCRGSRACVYGAPHYELAKRVSIQHYWVTPPIHKKSQAHPLAATAECRGSSHPACQKIRASNQEQSLKTAGASEDDNKTNTTPRLSFRVSTRQQHPVKLLRKAVNRKADTPSHGSCSEVLRHLL